MGRRKNELTHLYRDHLGVYSKVKPAPQLSHCPSAGRWNAEQDGGGELFPPFHDSILLDLFKCLFTLFQEPLTSAPPSPRTSLPITPPPFPLPPVPTLSEGPRVRNLGTETSPSCPLLQFFQSSSGSVGGGSEKALNHRRIWKWWKRAGWCWKPEVGICPDAARGQECGH